MDAPNKTSYYLFIIVLVSLRNTPIPDSQLSINYVYYTYICFKHIFIFIIFFNKILLFTYYNYYMLLFNNVIPSYTFLLRNY